MELWKGRVRFREANAAVLQRALTMETKTTKSKLPRESTLSLATLLTENIEHRGKSWDEIKENVTTLSGP